MPLSERVGQIGIVEQERNLVGRDISKLLYAPYVFVVSDFDHTLLDTSSFHKPSFQYALQVVGRDFKINSEIGARLRGKTDQEILEILMELSGGYDERLLHQASLAREEALIHLVQDDMSKFLISGVDSFVRSMRSMGRQIGIASASPDSFVQKAIHNTFVDGISIGDTFPSHGIIGGRSILVSLQKPNVAHVELSAHAIGRVVNRPLLYIGDGEVDGKSVEGKPGLTGLIVNKEKRERLESRFVQSKNILVVGSLEEVLR